ncbi:Schwann cell myelin protein-like [Cetorhinus maximus]
MELDNYLKGKIITGKEQGGLVKPTANSSVMVVEGNSSLLYCTVRGTLASSLRWEKNDEEISSCSTDELKQMVHNMTSEGDGEYWCVAEYNLGTVNSSTSTPVQLKPRIIVGLICTFSANWTNYTCRVRANPPANITWGLNETILSAIWSEMEIISLAVNRCLVQSSLRLVLPTGTGNLVSCEAANKQEAKLQLLIIIVAYIFFLFLNKPRIIVGPTCSTSEYWTNCTCRIRANPPANITWGLNGRILPGIMSDVEIITRAANKSLVQSSLRLVLPTGTGNMISCKAANKHGDSISKYQLHTEGIFPWIIVIPVGAVAAFIILILIPVKLQRKMKSDIACVPTANDDWATYAVAQHPWTTQGHGPDSNADVRETASNSAASEEILYASFSFSNFHKSENHLQIQEPSEYAVIKCK